MRATKLLAKVAQVEIELTPMQIVTVIRAHEAGRKFEVPVDTAERLPTRRTGIGTAGRRQGVPIITRDSGSGHSLIVWREEPSSSSLPAQ